MLIRPRCAAILALSLGSLSLLLAACSGHARDELFDQVWSTVDSTYPDPEFGGVDWREVGQRYRPLVRGARTDGEATEILNQMLYELGSSHTGIGPIDQASVAASAYLFPGGSPGIDLRLIEGQAVVFSVREGTAAEGAGLKPGDVLERIDGVSLAELPPPELEPPPDNPRYRRHLKTQQILRLVYGSAGTQVGLEYRDAKGDSQSVSLVRVARHGGRTLWEGLPEVFLETESRTLEGGVGYVRFNAFQPGDPQEILGAIASFRPAPGLILDLRGNDGGSSEATQAIASALLNQRADGCVVKTRHGSEPLVFPPGEEPFVGPLAILIDESSLSAAELLSSCLPAGRALLVGEQTPGAVMAGELELLPGNIAFVHPVAQYYAADGTLIEGRGAVPDLRVPLTREALSDGRDPQLEAALRALAEQRK